VRKIYLFVFIAFILAGCTEQEQTRPDSFEPQVVAVKGHEVPLDSLTPPVVIKVDESKLKKNVAGKPRVVPTGLNIHPAIVDKAVVVDKALLTTITPGTDSFPLPLTVASIDSPFVAGIPITVIAKDSYIREQNL
jgi:hypothetical protein